MAKLYPNLNGRLGFNLLPFMLCISILFFVYIGYNVLLLNS